MNLRNKRLVAIFSVFVMCMMAVSVTLSTDGDSDAVLPSYSYTLNLSNMSLSVSGMNPISRTDNNYTNTSFNAGSWTWDEKGYGPFNSFYALFDANTGKMLGHLDPYDLSKYILPSGKKGQSAPITSNNVMWCIPTVYVTSTSTSITFSSENTSGSTAYAHMIGNTTYNYLAIGVYEGTNTISGSDTGKFLSVSGQSPQVSKMREEFRAEAITTPTPDSNVKGMLWNYYQWQLYRICALMTMESFDSQGVVGYGNANSTKSTTTGTMNASGPYAGCSTTSNTTSLGAKLFIENAWGSVLEFVDDAVWYNGNLYVGHTGSPSDEYSSSSSNKYMSSDGLDGKTSIWSHSATNEISGYGGSVGTGNVSIWGFPTATGESASSGTYDWIHIPRSDDSYARLLCVGGSWYRDDLSGVSSIITYTLSSTGSVDSPGSRLSFVFDADPASTPTVTLDHSNLTAKGGVATGFDTELPITDTATYPDLNTVTSNPSIQAGWIHVGWEVDGVKYDIGSSLASTESHTAYSIWLPPQITITFMVEGKVHSTLQVPKGSVGVVYTPLMVEGVFEGWYKDAGYTNKYRADEALNDNITLYAKGVPPLVFTSEPNAAANIQQVNSYGMFFFDATDSSGRYQIHWDFGDGNTSTDAIAYNTYSEPGLYTVTLTVTNIYGESATSTYEIDLRDGSATNDVKWFAIGALCVIVAGFVVRRIL